MGEPYYLILKARLPRWLEEELRPYVDVARGLAVMAVRVKTLEKLLRRAHDRREPCVPYSTLWEEITHALAGEVAKDGD